MKEYDFIVIGAGIAGLTLEHALKEHSVLLLDPHPAAYKIGESIVPQHFMEPSIRPLYERIKALPSASIKEATLFISAHSIGHFPPFREDPYTLHVTRPALEEETAKFFESEITQERVRAVDLEASMVVTENNRYVAKHLIADCSGPSALVGRSLGLMREVWPIFASWSYYDILETQREAMFRPIEEGTQSLFRFNNSMNTMEQSTDFEDIVPSRSTLIFQLSEDLWMWQIPLYRSSVLSLGLVSRTGPISEQRYRELVDLHAGSHYKLKRREAVAGDPYRQFHSRNHFAWAADRFAGDNWALVGDAAFFGDPVYSVGTAFATNHALQLAEVINSEGWSPEVAAAFHQHGKALYDRAKQAYDQWYFGELLGDLEVATEIERAFINGRAFQVQNAKAFTDMWNVVDVHPSRDGIAANRPRAEALTKMPGCFLDPDEVAGWSLSEATVAAGQLRMIWSRPDHPELTVTLDKLSAVTHFYKACGEFAISYEARDDQAAGGFDGQVRGLLGCILKLLPKEEAALMEILELTPES